jgi:hypothetical protein
MTHMPHPPGRPVIVPASIPVRRRRRTINSHRSPQQPRIIQLPRVTDPRGNLTAVEGGQDIPFEIQRVYYLYDVPGGETRGGHAHRQLQQLIIAASGSFTVLLDDGFEKHSFFLNRSYYGLFVPRMMWRELEDFSTASMCLVLASDHYREDDYYREYADFARDVRRAA